MSIKRFFDKQVVVKRFKDVGSNKRSYYATATVWGAVQTLGKDSTYLQDVLDSRGWVAWFDEETDIREGDQIVDSDGVKYRVKQITKREYGINQHLETLLEEFNA